MFYRNVEPTEARVHTTQFRIIGRLHVPRARGTAEFLNADERPHLSMTHCSMYASGIEFPPKRQDFRYETDFAAVPKDQIAWLAGGEPQEPDPNLPREDRQVYLVYTSYVLTGRLLLRPRQRTSDFLVDAMGRRPFQTLYDARVMRPEEGVSLFRLPTLERIDSVVVNLRAAGGIFDMAPERDDPGFTLEED